MAQLRKLPQFTTYGSAVESLVESVKTLSSEIALLKKSLGARSKNVLLSTFAPEPYVVKRRIPVNIELIDAGFIATFFDANLSTSGETEEEAFSNLRSLILDTFEALDAEPETDLGPEPARQLAVLTQFLGPSE